MGLRTYLLPVALFLSVAAFAASASATPQSRIEAKQFADRLEVLVDNPENQIGSLYIRQFGVIDGPIRLSPGENRYTYRILTQDQPLSHHPVELAHYSSAGVQVDFLEATIVEPWIRPDEPALALTASDIRTLVKRYKLEQRASSIIGRIVDEMDLAMQNAIAIPDVGGTWINDYVCPDHEVPLQMVTLHQHRCPIDDYIWTGESFDRGLATLIHKEISLEAWQMAVSYTVTGDPVYGQRVADILLGYAVKYPNYIQHDVSGAPSANGGKAFGQTLDEAEWLTELVRAEDLIHGSGLLNEAQELLVHENVIRPAMEVILTNNNGIHNTQCWQNTGVFLAAMVLGEVTIADEIINGPTGLYEQFNLGIDEDGMWLEGSFGYHYFAFRAMLPMLQGLQRIRPNYSITDVKQMLMMPLGMAFPNGRLAQLNDGPAQSFESNLREVYEQGLAFFPQSEFCGPLVQYGRGTSLASVIFGVANLPYQDWVEYPLANNEVSGLAALKSNYAVDRATLVLDYGPHGGVHGHFDKLGINLWRGDTPVFNEAGDIGVDVPMTFNYYRTSLAHNTIVIDGQSQQASSGKLEHFTEEGNNSFILASADDAYADVSLRRQVTMAASGNVVDGVEVVANGTRTIDYVLHSPETIMTTLNFSAGNLGFSGPYDYLSNVRVATTDDDFRVRFRSSTGDSLLDFIGEPGTQIFLADAPGSPQGSSHEVLIIRRITDRTVFGATVTRRGSELDDFAIELDDQNPEQPVLRLKTKGEIRFLRFYQ
jgi:oligo-alginate lyase